MQGYPTNNQQWLWPAPPQWCRHCLIFVLLTCSSVLAVAQSPSNDRSLTWYVPKATFYRGGANTGEFIEYTSLTDLAKKLAIRGDKPYHLTIRLEKTTEADWQVLGRIASPTSLAVEFGDSLPANELMPILATWSTLEKLELTSISVPRSFTVIASSKRGEAVLGAVYSRKKIPATGWTGLRSVKEVLLGHEIDLQQAVSELQNLPALEALTIRQFNYSTPQDVTALARLSRLKKLTLLGQARVPPSVYKGLTSLTALTVYDPDIRQLNEGLFFLKNLQQLDVQCFPVSALRLGTLQGLQELRIQQIPNRSVLVPNDQTAASATKRAFRLLDSTFTGLTTLQRLRVEGVKLEAFPESLLENKGLVFLSMPDANLTALPENLDQLVSLAELVIDNNPLHRLPDAICQLPRLHGLSANQCELDSLPVNMGRLTSLTTLSLSANRLTSLPASMGQLQQLRQLNLSMNQLTALPDRLGTLPKLETVAAFGNKITHFPLGLQQVRELYLTDNQIGELPASLGTLKRLRTLVLDTNPLTYLPESIGQLDSLETLVLGQNLITALPASIGSLRQLRRFTFGQNQVRSLPETIGGLTSLTSISISNNPISTLPTTIGGWSQLKRADLDLSQLEAIPEAMGRWDQLRVLVVNSGRLLVLPAELGDCQQLTDLSIIGKRLIGLPESIGKLTRLQRLTLVGQSDSLTGQGLGQVVVLPSGLVLCRALTELTIQHQRQFDGTEAMQIASVLPTLNRLSFINCGITDLSGIPWKKLTALTINLSQNRISQLPESVLEMPNLEQADLSDTNLPAPLNRFFRQKADLVEAFKAKAEN